MFQGELQYEVRGVAPGSDYFYIEKTSGELKVLKALNRATAVSYKVSRVPGHPCQELVTTTPCHTGCHSFQQVTVRCVIVSWGQLTVRGVIPL